MAAPMSDEELYQLTGSWEAAAALRDQQAQAASQNSAQATPVVEAAKPATLSATPTLAELKAMYDQLGAMQARENMTEQGTTIDYIPIDYGNGWMAGERDNRKIIDYIGQGMDATPVYDDAPKTLGGFSRQEGDYVYNYDTNGNYLGRTKWNENMLKSTIQDLGPIALAALAGPGAAEALGTTLFGLTGTAAAGAAGALAGGVNAWGNDQNILKGALLGGVSGAGSAKLGDILGADTVGKTFENATLGDVNKAINFAQNPTLTGAANLASKYVPSNFDIGDTGLTTSDVIKGVTTAQALGSGNYKQVFDAVTGLAKGTNVGGLTADEQAQLEANRAAKEANRLSRIEDAVLNQPASDDGSTAGILDLINQMYPAAEVKGMSQADLAKFLEANMDEMQGSAELETLLKGAGKPTADEGTLTVTGNREGGSDYVLPTTKSTVTKPDNPDELVITDKRDDAYVPSIRTKDIVSSIPDTITPADITKLFPDLKPEDILQLLTPTTKVTTPAAKTTTPTSTAPTTKQLMANLGLTGGQQAPVQDPYANIKLMEEMFGPDIAYKLVSPTGGRNLASTDLDALEKLLRG